LRFSQKAKTKFPKKFCENAKTKIFVQTLVGNMSVSKHCDLRTEKGGHFYVCSFFCPAETEKQCQPVAGEWLSQIINLVGVYFGKNIVALSRI